MAGFLRAGRPRIGVGIAMAALLAGCAPGPDGGLVRPDFPFLPRYQGGAGTPVLLDNVAWWERLHDPVLDALIARALQGNVDLAVARARVEAAEAERASLPGAAVLTSSAGLRVEGDRDGSDLAGPLRLGFDWLLDPYGARRDRLRAATARVEAAEAENDAARLLLIFGVSSAYLELRAAQERVDLGRREMTNRQRTLRLIETLEEAQEATRLEVVRAEARIAELRAERPGLEAAVAVAGNRIAILLGAPPGTLPEDLAARLRAGGGIPRPALSPDIGIPADLLRNRPDIRVAESRYAAALAELDAAEAERYPSLSLSGAITLDVLGGGLDYFLGPTLRLPDLPGTEARATVAQRHAEVRAAFAEWQGVVLDALLEVENALVVFEAATTAEQAAADAVRLYGETLDLTRDLYQKNQTTLGDLIDAELALAASDRRLSGLRAERAQAFVELNVRLGAGSRAGAGQS